MPAARPSDRYSSPTFSRKERREPISFSIWFPMVSSRSLNTGASACSGQRGWTGSSGASPCTDSAHSLASATESDVTCMMERFAMVTASASGRSRSPPHASQGRAVMYRSISLRM